LGELGLAYVVGITGQANVWAPSREPIVPEPRQGRGRQFTRLQLGGPDDPLHRQQSVKSLAFELSSLEWYRVSWREGTNQSLRSRFARVRVRAAHRDEDRKTLREPEWLLIEWPEDEPEPTKYWLSTLAEDVTIERLVYEAKMRWRIERDYQDLKQDLGLEHYEGRGWRGLPSPRQPEHCRLRIPDRAAPESPRRDRRQKKLRTRRRTCPTHALQASRQPCARSATSPRRSPVCGCVSPRPCSGRFPDVRAACA
jgi:hypothetical protein